MQKQKITATVTAALGGQRFRVTLHNDVSSPYVAGVKKAGDEVVAYLAGKFKMNRISVIENDTVEVEMDPFGRTHRIVWRQ